VSDDDVIEYLEITSTVGDAVQIDNTDNVTLRHCKINHDGGHGIDAQNNGTLKIHDVDIVYDGAPPTGENSGEFDNIALYLSPGAIVTNVRASKGSALVYVNDSDGVVVSFLEGYDVRGPNPRGNLCFFNASDDCILQDFSIVNIVGQSMPQDIVNIYQSDGCIVRRGYIDTNDSPTGICVICGNSWSAPWPRNSSRLSKLTRSSAT